LEYVRYVDLEGFSAHEFDGQILWNTQSCLIACVREPPGTSGRGRHTHPSDQLFLILEGELNVELAGVPRRAVAGNAVFLPRDIPHWQWNEGQEDLFILEIILTPPGPDRELVVPFAGDPVAAGSGAAFVLDLESEAEIEDAGHGLRRRRALGRDDGSPDGAAAIDELEPGAGAPPWHIHDHDQFAFVLSGRLTADVAQHRYEVDRFGLLAIPAGVPHRVWNNDSDPERHLSVVTPAPSDLEPQTIEVAFSLRERTA
jgi:quercetin dioxygenase-like cupin family protein